MENKLKTANQIEYGESVVGIEFGSTRIKTILTDTDNNIIASGSHTWQSKFVDGVWTYDVDDVIFGMQRSYADLFQNVKANYGVTLKTVKAIGISAMMHGYIALNKDDNLLVPFRTWQNNRQEQASEALSALFDFHIPQRWSIAHLYQCILNHEAHLFEVKKLTTLAGYIHYKLTNNFVLGVGDASGMFPTDSLGQYDGEKVHAFDSILKANSLPYTLTDILPRPLFAGECAGKLTVDGAKLLDISGNLVAGVPLCAPEGDAGTGMTATNGITSYRGNVSAGTSAFAMVVLDKPLKRAYPQIDVVATPTGNAVAMVHCNNCTSDINEWEYLFEDLLKLTGQKTTKNELFEILFNAASKGDSSCGDLLTYNYLSGEHIVGLCDGRPLLVRKPNSVFSIANLMKANLFSALAVLRTGMDVLRSEDIKIDCLCGHGGFFKSKGVGQRFAAAALNTPVTVMDGANEGGAWGIALLASYMANKSKDEQLSDFLDNKVFSKVNSVTVKPDKKDAEDFEKYLQKYIDCLPIERQAVQSYK